jgi:hypothetical protein
VVSRGRKNLVGQLVRLRLRFLDADNVGFLLRHPVEKPLPGSGPNAICIQADNAKQM